MPFLDIFLTFSIISKKKPKKPKKKKKLLMNIWIVSGFQLLQIMLLLLKVIKLPCVSFDKSACTFLWDICDYDYENNY